ncbi:MAG: SRPBCC domain-containing protein [Pseudomonadota bacterium]
MIDPAGILRDSGVERPAPDALAITRVFTVQPGVLWTLFTDPARFAAWWGPKGATCTECALDLRPGGAWRTVIRGDDSGEIHVIRGVYVEVEAPHRLVFTWFFGDAEPSGPVSEVTLDFAARGRGSELRLFHRSLPPEMADNHERGWLGAFESLDDHIIAEGL